MPRPALNINWPAQPYTAHNNASLARLLGCNENTVAGQRAYHAPETATPRGRPPVDLSKADFTMHNVDIAAIWGCHPDVVRDWRRTHDVPATSRPRRSSGGRPRVYDRRRFDPRKDAASNAMAMGCSYQLAWLMLKQHKMGRKVK